VTLGDPNPLPQTNPISTICIAFHIFVVGEHRYFTFYRDFKFGVQIGHSKSLPTDDKQSLEGA